MKVVKTILVDSEIAERLRVIDNISALINKLLKEYFEIRSEKSSLLSEKEALLNHFKQKIKQNRKDIKIIKEWTDLKLDRYAINWLKTRERKPDEYEIKIYIKNRELDIPVKDFIKARDMLIKFGGLLK